MEIENKTLISCLSQDLKNDTLIIPNGIEQIKNSLFKNVQNKDDLKTLWLPKTCKYIDSYAFSSCHNLENVLFYDSEIDITKYENGELAKDDLDKNNELVTIGNSAFSYTNITSFYLPKTLSKLGKMCFSNTNLSDVIFQDEIMLETLNSTSFSYCKNLKTINIPSSVKNFEMINIESLKHINLFKFEGDINIINLDDDCLQQNGILTNTKLEFLGSEVFGEINLQDVLKVENNFNMVALTIKQDNNIVVKIKENNNVSIFSPNKDLFSFDKVDIYKILYHYSALNMKVFQDVMNENNYKNKVNVCILDMFKTREEIETFIVGCKKNKIFRNIEKKVNAFYELSNSNFRDKFVKGLISFSFMMGVFSSNEELRQKSADFIYSNILKTNDVYSVYNFLAFDRVDLFNNENESYLKFWKDNYKKLLSLQVDYKEFSSVESVKFFNYLNNNFERLKAICKDSKQAFTVKNIINIYNNENFVCDNVKKRDIYEVLKKYPNRTQENIDFVYQIKQEMEQNKISQNIFEKTNELELTLLYNESQLKDKLKKTIKNGYTYDFINKYKTMNLTYAIDDRTGCANIFNRGVGIVTCGMKLDNCQNLRIFNPKGVGVARATLMLDKENGTILYNTFMVYGHTRMSKEEKEDILTCFEIATVDFIREYKKNFPNNPKIKQVNVGLNCNGLRDLFDKDKIKTTKQLKGINFSLYGNLNNANLLWNGDWEEGQYCLLNSVQLRKANVLMNKNNNNNNEDCVITK